MRIVKQYEERKTEILVTAERLFQEKGYEACKVTDIVKELGIAKGTFFYYFPTKEAALNEIIRIKAERIRVACLQVIQDDTGTTEEHFITAILCVNQVIAHEQYLKPEVLHAERNSLVHQKTQVALIKVLTPILVQIVQRNNKLQTPSMLENNIMILLSSVLILLDDDLFIWEEHRKKELILSIIQAAGLLLHLNEEKLLSALQNCNYEIETEKERDDDYEPE